jgi:1,4-dihydroxy-2-naphthoyl-CoA hydrolase
MVWKNPIDLALVNQISKNTLSEHIGIEIIEIGDDYIKATMPVDQRTKQPMGLLHGGASVVLSETLGSIASIIAAGPFGQYSAVGVEISAHHLNSAKSGIVTGICKPLKIGKTIQVWITDIFDENNTQICTSKLTTFIKKLS